MKNHSLRGRLVRVLVTLQVTASLSVLAIFVMWAWATDRMVDQSGTRVSKTIADALARAPSGQLMLNPSPRTDALFAAAPDLWFIARDEAGHEVRRGSVPDPYAQLVRSGLEIGRSALDLIEDEQRPRARFERIDTPNGYINLVVQTGGPLSLTDTLKWWLTAFLILVAPIAVVTTLVVVVATPPVVRKGLKPVTDVAADIERVDIDSLARPLSEAQVPIELRPFVATVNRAFERLGESHDRQKRFLADAAHELRSPIATLRIQVDTLPSAVQEKISLQRSAMRLAVLAENLLNVQRLERSIAVFETVDLLELCERVVGDLAPLVIASGCSVSLESSASATAAVDVASVERALSNLILNAVEHGGPGCDIRVAVRKPSTIAVEDSGPGIPPADRKRVLEPFRTLNSSTRGTGLGLFLVAEVAKLHQGQLTIGDSILGGASVQLALLKVSSSL